MIESFKHKGLQELFTTGKTKRLPQERLKKIKGILTMVDAAINIADLRIPAFRLHQLKTTPYVGYWSIDVTGNFRIVFMFSNGKSSNLDYLDTH